MLTIKIMYSDGMCRRYGWYVRWYVQRGAYVIVMWMRARMKSGLKQHCMTCYTDNTRKENRHARQFQFLRNRCFAAAVREWPKNTYFFEGA